MRDIEDNYIYISEINKINKIIKEEQLYKQIKELLFNFKYV